MNGPYKECPYKETPERFGPTPPWEDAVRRWPLMNQEANSHQTPNLTVPLILDFPTPRIVRNKFLFFISHPAYGILL